MKKVGGMDKVLTRRAFVPGTPLSIFALGSSSLRPVVLFLNSHEKFECLIAKSMFFSLDTKGEISYLGPQS